MLSGALHPVRTLYLLSLGSLGPKELKVKDWDKSEPSKILSFF